LYIFTHPYIPMKKPILITTLLLFVIASANAQIIKNLFQQRTSLSRDFHAVAGKYEALQIDRQQLSAVHNQARATIDLQIPFENKLLKLKLHKASITADNFSVIEALPGGSTRTVNYSGAIFYQGNIEGKEHSFATISIFNNQVMGVIADEKSNIILGAIEDHGKATDEYSLYREKDLKIPDPFICGTSDIPVGGNGVSATPAPTALRGESVGEPVDIYFECDYKFYQDKGSNTNNVINYVLGFFNNTALLYGNENIRIQVSQILVWTTLDPEAAAGANTTSDVLNSFSVRMATATFSGDYAHFLTTRSLGGGIAYIPGNPCSSGKQFKTGVSAINNTYNDFPTYSWTVEVVTHELGHNLGSNHTQWCGWVGGALDNCYATEGGCAAGPAPTNGGTIMSYCHLTSTGINLNNGFGQQPGDKIRAVVAAATCFGNCRMTIALTKVDASCGQNNGTATVTATNGTGALTYTWSNGQTTSNLYNAGPGTYNVTVKDAAGCQVMGVVTLVNTGGTLNATLTPSTPTSFCTGSNVLLTATNNVAYTYQWYKDAVLISGATLNTYTATATGVYSVTVVSGACSANRSVSITEVPIPAAAITAGGATTFCTGGSVVLNGSAGSGYTYQWYNNGTAVSGATNATYTATTSASYTVKVSAGTCQSTSSPVTVTANPAPSATITAGSATTFCSGGSVILNANTGAGYSYQWYNNTVAIGGATNSSYTATTSGSYTVKITSNSCGTTSSATTVSVVSPPNAVITAGGATTFCSGSHVTLNATSGTGYTYQWYNNGTAIGAATNAAYDAVATGSYTVKVSSGSCQATSTIALVTVNPTPSASITAGGATSFCLGGNVALNANTGSGYTYQWYNNGTAITGATNILYNAATSGNYTVKVAAGGCQNTSSGITVVVNTIPQAVITPNGPTAFCTAGSVDLNVATGAGYSYQWYNNGIAINTAVNASYHAVIDGNYTVKVISGTCQATSLPVTVTVSPAPDAVITTAGADHFCAGSNLMLNANTGTGYVYQWYRDGVAVAGAANAAYQATNSGNYAVTINLGTCSSTSTGKLITVWPNPAVIVTPTLSTIQKFQTQTLTAEGATAYNWSSQPALVGAITGSAVFEPLTTTNYMIEGTDNNGCKSTAAASIFVIGCGDATDLHATPNSPARALVTWTNPPDATTDTLQYRKTGATGWTKLFVSGQVYEVNGLEPNTDYEYNIIPLCNTATSFIPSASQTFKTLSLNTGIYINLYPNPVISPAKLEIILDKPFSLQVSLYNNMGQIAKTISSTTLYPAGQVIKTIDPSGLRPGMYTVAILIDGKRYNLKMIVLR
jgi:Metallo-peptidase family M12/SprB repeat/Ig-like domain CHU_C associated/Fibronectin type III domain/Reprolysin family propeptide